MVYPAKRYSELVADFATEGTRLHEPKVMRIRGLARADETRLPGHEAEMVFVAVATRRANSKNTLVNAIGVVGRSGPARFTRFCRVWNCNITPR